MKRELDLIRAILLHFEQTEKPRVGLKNIVIEGWTVEQIAFHVDLMKEAELLNHQVVRPQFPVGGVGVDMGLRPTMKGYEMLDSIRDPEVWRRTKDASMKIGGVGVDLLWEIAKGIAKQRIKDTLGIEIG